ncbi:hypothetical protein MRB53_038914 [Persea americana]|nr:hypothetical protein MRB53_038914 [Persea americana]
MCCGPLWSRLAGIPPQCACIALASRNTLLVLLCQGRPAARPHRLLCIVCGRSLADVRVGVTPQTHVLALDCRIVLVYEVTLYELYCKARLADSTTTNDHQLVLSQELSGGSELLVYVLRRIIHLARHLDIVSCGHKVRGGDERERNDAISAVGVSSREARGQWPGRMKECRRGAP